MTEKRRLYLAGLSKRELEAREFLKETKNSLKVCKEDLTRNYQNEDGRRFLLYCMKSIKRDLRLAKYIIDVLYNLEKLENKLKGGASAV